MATTPLHDALGLPRPGAPTDGPGAAPGDGIVLATVGGGGKTTLLFALAAERAAARTDDSISVLTTTTKFTVPKAGESIPTVLATNALVRAAAIADVRGRGLPTVLVAAGRGDRGRLLGVEPSWPAQARGVDGVGFVGVEADGAGGRPFKAPASHEPVIPDRATHVLAVVGVEALGKPLGGHWVHRPERVSALTGAAEGDAVTAAMIGAVLSHAEGGRKGAPAGTRFGVLVTRARHDIAGARAIAAACREHGVATAVIWDATEGLIELV